MTLFWQDRPCLTGCPSYDQRESNLGFQEDASQTQRATPAGHAHREGSYLKCTYNVDHRSFNFMRAIICALPFYLQDVALLFRTCVEALAIYLLSFNVSLRRISRLMGFA